MYMYKDMVWPAGKDFLLSLWLLFLLLLLLLDLLKQIIMVS